MKDNSSEPSLSPGRRAARYWFVDGLPQVLFGLTLLVLGAAVLLWRMYLSRFGAGYALIIGGGFSLYYFFAGRILDHLKSRLTYPRTGYALPPEEIEQWETLTMLSLRPVPPKENVTSFWRRTVIVIFFFVLTPWNSSERWLVPLLATALAVVLYAANQATEHDYSWSSALGLGLMGAVFFFVNTPLFIRPSLPFLLVGSWLAAQGGWTLMKYLRKNPSPQVPEGVRT